MLECANKRATGELVELSEQHLLDCTRTYAGSTSRCPNTCDGGGCPMDAFNFVLANRRATRTYAAAGLATADNYPYHLPSRMGECKVERPVRRASLGYRQVPKDELSLQRALVQYGPLSVIINSAGIKDISPRADYIYSRSCSTSCGEHCHVVLLIGYGSNSNGDYWLIKNSWGADWGDEGYFRLARNKQNMCGIVNHAIYP